jgi:hypothetical protein
LPGADNTESERCLFIRTSGDPSVPIEALLAIALGITCTGPSIDAISKKNRTGHSPTSPERDVMLALTRSDHLHAIAATSGRSYKFLIATSTASGANRGSGRTHHPLPHLSTRSHHPVRWSA